MIDHVFLLLLMGLAAAGAVVIVLDRGPLRHMRIAAAIAWYAACLVPLVALQADHLVPWSPLATSLDFGGAAALHASLFVYLRSVRAAERTAVPARRGGGMPRSIPTTIGMIALATAVWCAWLVALDGHLGSFTALMLANCILLAIAGAGAALLLAVIRRRAVGSVMWDGAVAGLAAGSAAAASLPVAGAVAVGVVAGMLAGSPMKWGAGSRLFLGRSIDAAGVGAVVGLLAIGLLDTRAGFFFTGQPTLVIGQLMLIAAAVILALLVGIAVRATAGRSVRGAPDQT